MTEKQADERTETTKALHRFGFVASIAWLVVVGLYAANSPTNLFALDPNEFGDFLAGAFAPLAFLWLVLGFLQQGEELRYSSRALYLQGEELRNSVEQQKALVETTKEQLDLEREAFLSLLGQRRTQERIQHTLKTGKPLRN